VVTYSCAMIGDLQIHDTITLTLGMIQ